MSSQALIEASPQSLLFPLYQPTFPLYHPISAGPPTWQLIEGTCISGCSFLNRGIFQKIFGTKKDQLFDMEDLHRKVDQFMEETRCALVRRMRKHREISFKCHMMRRLGCKAHITFKIVRNKAQVLYTDFNHQHPIYSRKEFNSMHATEAHVENLKVKIMDIFQRPKMALRDDYDEGPVKKQKLNCEEEGSETPDSASPVQVNEKEKLPHDILGLLMNSGELTKQSCQSIKDFHWERFKEIVKISRTHIRSFDLFEKSN